MTRSRRLAAALLAAALVPPAPAANAAAGNGRADAAAETRLDAASLWTRQQHNAAALRQAFAALGDDWRRERHDVLDALLAQTRVLLDEAGGMPPRHPVARAIALDYLVALAARGRAREALALADALEADGSALPPYAELAAADASMQAREPEAAARRYRAVIASGYEPARTRIALAYAQLEAEDLDGLAHTLQQIEAEGGDADRHRLLAAMARYLDEPRRALVHLAAARHAAPADLGNTLEAAAIDAARGLTRAAQAGYEAVLAAAPDNVAARIGRAETMRARGDHRGAAAERARLLAEAPEHPAVRRLAASAATADRPLLTMDYTRGSGDGKVEGNDDTRTDLWLFSQRIGDLARVFAHHHHARATFDGDLASHARSGVGIELAWTDWEAAVEVGHAQTNGHDTGVAWRLGWQADDRWSFRLVHERRSDDVPIKGRKRWTPDDADLHARRSVVGAAYRVDESRRIAIDWTRHDFSDGNVRDAWNATWTERLVQAPRHTLDLQAALYASDSSRARVNYFNPERDYAASLTLSADWLAWRHYERRFNHRVAGTLGRYRQYVHDEDRTGGSGDNYGTRSFHELRYEHDWQFGDALALHYGIARRVFPYDGDPERKLAIYAGLSVRF